MDLDNIFRLVNNFFHTHTYIAIAIAAFLAIIVWLRPKQTLKTVLVILAALLAAYVLYYIGKAAMAGLSGKEQMFTK